MDPDLYDEFGNYVGPDLESEEDSSEEEREDRDEEERMEEEDDDQVKFNFDPLQLIKNLRDSRFFYI